MRGKIAGKVCLRASCRQEVGVESSSRPGGFVGEGVAAPRACATPRPAADFPARTSRSFLAKKKEKKKKEKKEKSLNENPRNSNVERSRIEFHAIIPFAVPATRFLAAKRRRIRSSGVHIDEYPVTRRFPLQNG